MPFATWLRAILPQARQAAPAQVAPKSAALLTGGNGTLLAYEQRHASNNDVRIHIAAHDPEFPAKREAAVKSITSAIDAVALAHGFTKKPKSWAKSGALGTVSIHIQRNHYGFDCDINLGFQPTDKVLQGPWMQDDVVPLGRFCPPNLDGLEGDGTVFYLDVFEDLNALSPYMAVLTSQALPWLLAHLTNPDAANQPVRSAS